MHVPCNLSEKTNRFPAFVITDTDENQNLDLSEARNKFYIAALDFNCLLFSLSYQGYCKYFSKCIGHLKMYVSIYLKNAYYVCVCLKNVYMFCIFLF